MIPAQRGPRVLGATRLSRYRDNSTSPERQEAAVERVAADIGGHVVGWARDMDVSASKVPPHERPELGEWMRRPDEFDVIAWWRLDRAVRKMADMAQLGQWAKDHKKRLIFAEGPGSARLELDFGSPMSELIMMVLAFAAQMEAEAIKERTTGASEFLRSVGRWSGGPVPFHARPVPHPTEDEGWWLGLNDESDDPMWNTAEIGDHMVDMALNDKSRHAISDWVNKNHPAVTPANHRRRLAGREIDPDARWNPGMVTDYLRNQHLTGRFTHNGKVVRDENGEYVVRGDALIPIEAFNRLQNKLDETAGTAPERRSDAHPLLGILHCGVCGGRLYQGWLSPGPNRKEPKRQYRCAARAHGKSCRKPAYVIADAVDRYAEDQFLTAFGEKEVFQIIAIPGQDHNAEIEELTADVEELSAQLVGLRGTAAAAVARQLQARSDRLDRLSAAPVIPPRTEVIATGETYAKLWRSEDTEGKRDLLRQVGVRIEVGETTRGSRDVTRRLSFDIGVFTDPEAAALAAVEREEQLA
ncbi:recombinase family protein [Kitasatospora sp. NPDC088548]|uniref:recombinase family protein n=1 Tax=Kitasatospora sp. NPDC088548 TaxID=3364075 RepID=UPI003827ECD1